MILLETAKFSRESLLSQLDYDIDATGADIVKNFEVGRDLSKDDQERSLHVIKSTVLAKWVQRDRSGVLVINGQAPKVTRKSAMSFVCARLVFALNMIRSGSQNGSPQGDAGRPDVVPLYFFCGQHTSLCETWESPSGIINSLLAQLLTHCNDVDLTRVTKPGRDFDNSDVENVFSLFKDILKQLSAETTIFCVLDAVSFYVDGEDTTNDAVFLVEKLIQLSKKKSTKGPVFKLLLTAPKRLHIPWLDSVSSGKELINVPISLRNTGGFTAMKWNDGLGRQLDQMAV